MGFLRFCGIASLIGAFLGMYYSYMSALLNPRPHLLFAATMAGFHLLMGVGLLARKRWGTCLLWGFLYALLLAFPVGTVLGYYGLKHLQRHRIGLQPE